MKVLWVEIDNVKSFKNLTRVVLNSDFNIIVGTNGSGKTTALQLITSCLLLLVPQRKTQPESKGLIKRTGFQSSVYSVDFPKNDFKPNDPQTIKLKISLEDSKIGLLKELLAYKSVFIPNLNFIQENFWGMEKLETDLESSILAVKGLIDPEIEINYFIENHNLAITPESVTMHEAIITVLGMIEKFRIVYNALYRSGKTSEKIDKGFHIIFLGADRQVGFPAEIGLGRGNEDEYHNNSAYTRSADLGSMVFSASSFDYVGQTLARIGEMYTQFRWNGNSAPLKSIPEFAVLKNLINEFVQLGFEVGEPRSPYDSMKFFLLRDGIHVQFEQLSSGEKSLINFLFTLANPDIKNSFIIVDEAEIHLHGNMQDALLSILFVRVEHGNQHFLSTHSAKFINKQSINSVLRFFKTSGATEYVNFRNEMAPRDDYQIIRLINSQNNEKVFFADRVVLVEGIKDRILIDALIEQLSDNKVIIEVIEVGGKLNLKLYKEYLDEIRVPNFTFADFDYLYNLKKSELDGLLVVNNKKIDEIIKGKKSTDRVALIDAIDGYLRVGDKAKLQETINYLKTRGLKLKSQISGAEKNRLIDISDELKINEYIYIPIRGLIANSEMYTGEIEDYLTHLKGEAGRPINGLVKYVNQSNFLEDFFKKVDAVLLEELIGFIRAVIPAEHFSANKLSLLTALSPINIRQDR